MIQLLRHLILGSSLFAHLVSSLEKCKLNCDSKSYCITDILQTVCEEDYLIRKKEN